MKDDLPLLPGQAWFLHEMRPRLLNPSRWNLYHVLPLPADVDSAMARTAVEALWQHHEALRATFHRAGEGWRQRIADVATTPAPYRVVDVSRVQVESRPQAITMITDQLQATLNLHTGPLARFVYVRTGADPHGSAAGPPSGSGAPGHLIVLVHHLVCDGLSLSVLVSDLEAVVDRLRRGQPPQSFRGAPYGESVRALAAHGGSAVLREELGYWTGQPWDDVAELSSDSPDRDGESLSRWATAGVVVEPPVADVLVRAWPARHGTSPEHVLLAVVADAISRWADGSVCVELLRHGRAHPRGVGGAAVLSPRVMRTVGWFSMAALALVGRRGSLDQAGYLRQVTEAVNGMPGQGLGANLLRWLAPPGPYSAILEGIWEKPTFVFNYFGFVEQNRARNLHVVDSLGLRKTRDVLQPRKPPIYLRVAVAAEGILVMIDHDPDLRATSGIADLPGIMRETFSRYAEVLGRALDDDGR